jgi:ankyrin repeat/BTB/POZ domain-containing protein 1
VKYLVTVAKVPLDEQDSHDATPLYLAALTGQKEICKFLLESGAKCDPDSGGDAARVFYVALTPELRKLLQEWSLSAASRDPYLDMLRKTFQDATHADTICIMDENTIYLHQVILRARCPRLANRVVRFGADGSMGELKVPSKHESPAMMQLLEYLYTGVLSTRDVETTLEARELAKEYNLQTLFQHIDACLNAHFSTVGHSDKDDLRGENKKKFRCDVSDLSLLRLNMAELARLVSTPRHKDTDIAELNELSGWSDVMIRCEEHSWSLHAAILCNQSEYFKCALEGGFREAKESLIDLSHLVPCPETLTLAIQWLYANAFLTTEPNLEVAVRLLNFGSAILCPRLIAYVSNTVLQPSVDTQNVLELLELSRILSLDRLEARCVEVVVRDLDVLAHDPRLLEFLANDASTITQTGDIQVTDVPLAAEMKSAVLKQKVACRAERDRQLGLLQQMVDKALTHYTGHISTPIESLSFSS